MANLPTLRVLAAVLCIDPDDPDDAEDLEAAGLLLARRVLRALRDDPHDRGDLHGDLPGDAPVVPVAGRPARRCASAGRCRGGCRPW